MTPTPKSARSTFAVVPVAVGLIGLAFATRLVTLPASVGAFLDALVVAAGAAATVATARAWRRLPGAGRPAWALLGATSLLLTIGALCDLHARIFGGAPLGLPSALEATTALAASLGAIGLHRLCPPRAFASAVGLLDAAILVGGVTFITWAWPLHGGQALLGMSVVDDWAVLVPVAATIALASVAVVLQTCRRPAHAPGATSVTLLLTSALSLAAAAEAVLVLSVHGASRNVVVGTAAMFVLGALVSLTAAAVRAEPEYVVENEADRRAMAAESVTHGDRTRLGLMLPSLATFAALATGVTLATFARIDWATGLIGGLLGSLFLGRELLLVSGNTSLVDELESRVAQRTIDLEAGERYYRTLVQNSSDVVLVIGADGRFMDVSESIRTVLGHDPADLHGRHFLEFVDPAEEADVVSHGREIVADTGFTHMIECNVLDSAGAFRAAEITIVNQLDQPVVKGLVCNLRDVSERRELEEQLYRAAYNDQLTQLANRGYLLHCLEEAIATGNEHGRVVGLVFLDLDGFKQVNDTLGHQAGDALLKVVAERIVRAVRPDDIVARLGGDEFAILLEDLSDPGHLSVVCARLQAELAEPVNIAGHPVRVQASIGAALSGAWAKTGEELLRNADLAMYHGKMDGKNRFESFRPELLQQMLDKAELEAELRRALDCGEFVLYYQPLVDLETDTIVSLEALCRWQHPERGLVSPADFIPLAEQSDLIVELGRWALNEACAALAQLSASSVQGSRISVAVNISGRHLSSTSLVNDVAKALIDSRLDGSRLTIEVTETLLFDETSKVVNCLARIRKLNSRVAIDDFGTGYSSLSKLSRLPIDTLKLDGSFVAEMASSPAAAAVVSTVIDLGKRLGLGVVGEGIATLDQLDQLRGMGLRIGQGYHLMRPVPLADIEAVLSVGDRAAEVL